MRELIAEINDYTPIEEVNEILDELDYCYDFSGKWIAFGSAIGWRNQTGHKIFEAENATSFIREAFGMDCNFSVKLYIEDDKYFYAVYSHHDSPTGEYRDIVRVEDYVKDTVWEHFTIQELQRFLTNYSRIAEASADIMTSFAEEKDRREYTKKDFGDMVYGAYGEDLVDFHHDQVDKVIDTIDYYANSFD